MRTRPPQRDEWRGLPRRGWALLLLGLFLGTLLGRYGLQPSRPASPRAGAPTTLALADDGASTLVVYVFRNVDALSTSNLEHFIASIEAGDRARYVFALDPTVPLLDMPRLPPLPERGMFVQPPPCFELGVVGWVLFQSGKVQPADYERFVWVSSAVRGPLLPAYERRLWHTLLTERLAADVGLVGPTISCSYFVFDPRQQPLLTPHVQHQVMATDAGGLRLLRAAGALDCHASWQDNLRFGEVGASAAVLRAGRNLDCLMKRYQRVDWRAEASWGCNARVEPHLPGSYDGVSLNPLEVLFLRLDVAGLVLEQPPAMQAAVYSQWAAEQRAAGAANASGNAWVASAQRAYDAVMARNPDCFDAELYRMASPVEFAGHSAAEAYEHFRTQGFQEGRPYAFFC